MKKNLNPLIKKCRSFGLLQLGTTLNLLEAINTPLSLSIAIQLRYDVEIDSSVEPSNYLCARSYILDSQALALVKKSTIVKTDKDIDLISLLHFRDVDDDLPRSIRDIEKNFNDLGFIYECQRMIHRILGKVPDFKDLDISESFTSGSTAGYKLTDSTIADKVSRTIDVSPHALPYLIQISKGNPTLFRLLMTHGFNSPSSEKNPYIVEVVPKQWNKRRVIIKHHFGDVLCQRTIAKYIKNRLKRWGIDIDIGQSVHQDVLRLFADSYATIDLSDASDRISPSLVKLLLPLDWYLMLKRLTNKYVKISGEEQVFEINKFCGQGNGFTFELETLIFFVISSIAVKRNGQDPKAVFVYGDDTIVPEASAHAVMDAYEKCGLKVNKSKSFAAGPFKESCGFDVYDGFICRPVYFKDFKPNENKAISIIKLHNRAFAVLEYLFSDIKFNSTGYRSILQLRECFNKVSRFFGPPEIGDSVLFCRDEYPKWEDQRAYYRTYRRIYEKSQYVMPSEDEASELAYIHLASDSRGSLPKNSRYKLRSARMYGFVNANWQYNTGRA